MRCIGFLQRLQRGHFADRASHATPPICEASVLPSPASVSGTCRVRARPASFLSRRWVRSAFISDLQELEELAVVTGVVGGGLAVGAAQATVRAGGEQQLTRLLVAIRRRP